MTIRSCFPVPKTCRRLSLSSRPDRLFHITLLVLLLVLTALRPEITSAQNHKIAVFGSSVAKGSGDTTGTGGYAGMLKSLLEMRGWTVVNVSKGGDNTMKITPRFETELLPEKPGYVIIGLSLGNEGIGSKSELTRSRVFERFRSGMVHLITHCRENGMTPVVVNCYARNDFGPEQYQAVQKMNLLINTWDVPSINALGAIDNGSGQWADGYWHDKSHPNLPGHAEIFHAFVPSLFEALAAGKKTPEKVRGGTFLSVSAGASVEPLTYTPDDSIRSFTLSFLVKSLGNGTIASLLAGNIRVMFSMDNGKICCHLNEKETFSADTSGESKGWQYVVFSYRHATGLTTLYVNGREVGNRDCFLQFGKFILGGSGDEAVPAPALAGYRDLLIYRSALNAAEVTALYEDCLLQSSLEVYAPLDDREFLQGTTVKNSAQSMSRVMIHGGQMAAASENGQGPPK